MFSFCHLPRAQSSQVSACSVRKEKVLVVKSSGWATLLLRVPATPCPGAGTTNHLHCATGPLPAAPSDRAHLAIPDPHPQRIELIRPVWLEMPSWRRCVSGSGSSGQSGSRCPRGGDASADRAHPASLGLECRRSAAAWPLLLGPPARLLEAVGLDSTQQLAQLTQSSRTGVTPRQTGHLKSC